jgi:hypothetical protein
VDKVCPTASRWPVPPSGAFDIGNSGAVVTQSQISAGRVWIEEYPPLKGGDVDVESFLTDIEVWRQRSIVFDIDIPLLPGSGRAPNGVGGGTPVVDGGSQTGTTLDIRGFPTGTANVIVKGDVFSIAGLQGLYRATETVSSDGSGNVSVGINPGIYTGHSPVDGASITLDGALTKAFIERFVGYPATRHLPGRYLGLAIQFREVPA